MQAKQISLFESERLTLDDSIALTIQSLQEHGTRYKHWAISFSGGKDSTTVLTLVLDLLKDGLIPQPQTLTVLYADTRMELPMLHTAAIATLAQARELGCVVKVVEPPLSDRFFVRMLGRGYPPPNNGFRWCVGLLKLEPMTAALKQFREESGEKFLTLTGMRIGESAARDQRIALSCSRNDGECSQGWFQHTTPASLSDVLAPIVHWRVCHVADWLMLFAPAKGYPTLPVIEAYGAGIGDTEALAARTGCIRCPVAGHDTTLDRVVKTASWAYLGPFLRLWEVYADLSAPQSRLMKQGERLKDGSLGKRPMRLGPLTMDARRWGLEQILALQDEVNARARVEGRPIVELITDEEVGEINRLIEANTWPDKWDGTEVTGNTLVEWIIDDLTSQPILFSE